MKTNEFKYNLDVILHLTQSNQNKKPLNLKILDQYSSFGSVEYFTIPVPIQDFIHKPELLDQYSFKNKDKDYFIDFFKKIVAMTSYERAENLRSHLSKSWSTAYYTPQEIIDLKIYELLKHDATKINNSSVKNTYAILEPSCGNGRYIKSIRRSVNRLHKEGVLSRDYIALIKSNSISIEGVEIEPIAWFISKKLYPEATIYSTPFQDTKLNYTKYDLITSNIPFSKNRIKLSKRSDKNQFNDFGELNLQQYYFYKGSSLLKDRGKLAYITSSVIADSHVYDDLRKHLVHNNNLLSNVRLPNSTFDNTQVISDYIVFERFKKQELSHSEELYKNIGIKKIATSEKGFKYNNYFLENPHNIMGEFGTNRMHGSESITLNFKESTSELVHNLIRKKLFEIKDQNKPNKESISALKKSKEVSKKNLVQLDLFESLAKHNIQTIEEKTLASKLYDIDYLEANNIKEHRLVFHDGIFGYFTPEDDNQDKFIFNEIKTDLSLNEKKLIFELLNSYESIFLNEDRFTKIQCQRNLIESYYKLTLLNPLNYYTNELKVDALGSEVLNLVSIENGKEIRSNILTDLSFFKEAKTEKLETYQDALMASLNKTNTIDFDFIKQSLKLTLSTEEIKKEMVEKDHLFIQLDKEGNQQFITKDVFISGNLYTKIDRLKNNIDMLPEWFSQEKYSNQLNLLNESKNPWLEFEDINIQLGNSWMSESYFQEFIESDLLGLASNTIKLEQFLSNSTFKIVPNRYIKNNAFIDQKYSIRRFGSENGRLVMDGIKLLEATLNNITPSFSYKETVIEHGIEKQVAKKDVKAFKLAQFKIKQIEQQWATFLAKLPVEEKRKIEKIYNYKYNNYVQRNVNGSHLQFNLANGIKLKDTQKNAVYQIIEDNGCVIDHKVGAGKTFTMVTASKKMKELGIIKKPVIACLKANVKEIYNDYKKLYPNAKVLFEEPNLSNKNSRKEYFAKIANNDWDCIIMKHDTLSRIPIPEDVEKDFLQEQVNKLKHDFDLLHENQDVSKRQLKGLRDSIDNAERRIEYLTESIKNNSDKIIYNIDSLGIDHLFVDESHHFKNVGFTSVHMNVAGLGTRKGSKKAVNLKMQIMTLHKKYGYDKGFTPLTGTVISNSMVELYNVLNMKAPNELYNIGIRSFDSFAKLYAIKSSDYEMGVTGDVKIKERFRNFVNIPELISLYKKHANIVNDHNMAIEKPQLVSKLIEVEPNDLQINFNDKLIEFVEEENGQLLAGITGKVYSEDQMNAKMLLCTNLSKKASIDMRLVNSSFPKIDNGKLDELCKNVDSIYKQFNDDKGVQIIFSDIGTPNKDENKFSVYDEIRKTLVENYTIPSNEIAFIHEHDSTLNKKQAFFKEVNKGKYRIILGSTSKLGTGVNIQYRCTALHHIDIPWRPSDMEQRNGRGERQGNWLAKEKNNNQVYATKKSLDAYNFQILAQKDEFIKQIKNGSITQRTFNEGDVGEGREVSYAVLSACVSGNTELLEKIKLEKELEKLEDEVQFKKNQVARAESNVEYYTKKIKELENQIKNLDKVKPQVEKNFGTYYKEENKDLLPPILNKEGVEIPSKEVDKIIQERYLNGILHIEFFENRDKLFSQGDYSLYLEKKTFINEKSNLEIYIRDDVNEISYKRRSNIIPKKDVIKIIPERLKNLEKSILNKKDEIEDNKSIIEKNKGILNSISLLKGSEGKINILKKEIKRLEKVVLSQSKEKKKRKSI